MMVVVVLCLMAGLGVAAAHHRVFRGYAVYYDDELAGNRMACGPVYRPWKMVAAHRTLPCGKRLRVKNLRNGEVVHVTVQDRGPFGDEDDILDVSRRAARRLGFYGDGRTRVRVVVLHP